MGLAHRIGMSPLTRLRASKDHVPLGMATEYYSQRASTPGTLLVSEGTFVSALDGGVPNVPGIYNEEQIHAWKEVTDAVHRQGSYIFCQLVRHSQDRFLLAWTIFYEHKFSFRAKTLS